MLLDMTIRQLKDQGYATYSELKPFIKKMIYKGVNVWGFEDKCAILEDNSYWDYLPEDEIYEFTSVMESRVLNINRNY